MGAATRFFVLFILVFNVGDLALARCRSGLCFDNGGSVCSSGVCGDGLNESVTCRNGVCSTNGQFQPAQFVGNGVPRQTSQQASPSATPAQTEPQKSNSTPGTSPTVSQSNAKQSAGPSTTPSARDGQSSKEFRVINSEPVDITQFAKKNGENLDRVMLNPETPLYVKMKANESDGGLFWLFMVDPQTGKASGKTSEGVKEFNFNDPYERDSLVQVKKYLANMRLDDALRKFLKYYWPNEELTSEQQKQPEPSSQSQVAQNDSRSNPTTHTGPSAPQPERPVAAPEPRGNSSQREQASVADNRQANNGRRPVPDREPSTDNRARARSLPSKSTQPASPSTSDGSSGGRVIVKVYKKSERRGVCVPCDTLYDNFASQIKGYDDTEWYVGGKSVYPTVDVFLQKDGQETLIQSVQGAVFSQINSAIATARQRAR